MRFMFKGGGVLLPLIICLSAFGQSYNPYAPGPPPMDPRQRRARLEQAVSKAPGARPFIEAYTDDAANAIFATSPMIGLQLAEARPELDKMPRPRELLRVIAQPRHGDDVARFAIAHAAQLQDVDTFDGFISSALEISLGLASLEQKAAEVRARRLNVQPPPPPPYQDWRVISLFGGCVGVAVLLYWWRRRSGEAGPLVAVAWQKQG